MRNLKAMKFRVVLAVLTWLILVGQLSATHLPDSAAKVFASSFPVRNADKSNPIVRENRHPGSDLWQVPWSADYQVADDNGKQIKGYTTNFSVKAGGSVDMKVTVTPAQDFQVDVLRLGYYQGHGARLMKHLGTFHGIQQPPCPTDPVTNMISCNWTTSLTLQVQKGWLSGVYVAVFTSAGKFQSLVPFWVVDSRPSDLLFLSSLNAYQAYNDYPYDPPPSDPFGLPQTGRSLYQYNSANGVPAVKVSFDRPFTAQYGHPGDGNLYDFEPELISFLEQNGYDVSYVPDPVVDQKPDVLLHHKAVVIGGHAEYWTAAEYDGAFAARAAGVGLAFISANEIYWHVRYEKNAIHVPQRVMVGYKDWAPDPNPDPSKRTIRWRDLGRPEQLLIGVQYPVNGNQNFGGQPFVPMGVDHWVYAGSGLQNGVPVNVEAVGYEIDDYDPTVGPPAGTEYTLLDASPFLNFNSDPFIHNMSIYRGSGGNWVWATGSMCWSWTLYPGGSSTGQNNVRPEMQIVTRTVLDRMIQDAPHPRK